MRVTFYFILLKGGYSESFGRAGEGINFFLIPDLYFISFFTCEIYYLKNNKDQIAIKNVPFVHPGHKGAFGHMQRTANLSVSGFNFPIWYD